MRVRRPVDKKHKISAEFGAVNPDLRDGQPHKGIDFGCPEGTEVNACFDGTIKIVRTLYEGDEKSKRLGNRVWLYSEDLKCRALYAHLSQFKCDPEEVFKAGQILAYSGNTGHSTGPHLHFELRRLPEDTPLKPEFDDEDTAASSVS